MSLTYTEMIDSFPNQSSSPAAWNNYDIYTNKGVPKDAIVEIACCHGTTTGSDLFGLRTDGSALTRTVQINEAEQGGENCVTIYVKVHETTGLIEQYELTSADDVVYRILGYFTNVDFTEKEFSYTGTGFFSPSGSGSFTDYTLPDGASLVHVITAVNKETDVANTMGVRENGSSLDRYVILHECEGGYGWNYLTFIVKADADKIIELYTTDTSNTSFFDQGYFSSAMDFVEGWSQRNQTTEGSWQPHDLYYVIDEDPEKIVSFLIMNSEAASENLMGVRSYGSSLVRYIDVHESEGAGTEYNGYTVSVLTANMGLVQLYAEEDTVDYFMFQGYFKPAAGGAIERTASASLSFTGATKRALVISRSKTASISLTGTSSRRGSIFQRISTGSLSFSASTNRIITLVREASASLTLTASTLRSLVMERINSATLTLTGESKRTGLFIRQASISLSLVASASRNFLVERIASASLSLTANAGRFLELTRNAVDSLSIVGNALRSGIYMRTASASLSLTGLTSRIITIIRQASASLSLTSASNRFLEITRNATASLTQTANNQRALILNRVASASLSLTGLSSRILSTIRNASASLTLTANNTRIKLAQRIASATLNLTASANRLLTLIRNASASISLLADASWTKAGILIRSASASLSLAGNSVRELILTRSTSASLSLTAIASRSKLWIRNASATLSLLADASATKIAATIRELGGVWAKKRPLISAEFFKLIKKFLDTEES